ncbi:MAG TPA: hypothetical protein VLB50_05825 [Ignavibacteriaceae bacterium]|nr:hypothetical protein [Ignavibacteriaceae bacterium]
MKHSFPGCLSAVQAGHGQIIILISKPWQQFSPVFVMITNEKF